MLQDTSGLYSLLSVMTYHKISADPEQIIHKFALRDKENLGDGDILRIAKEYGFKARLVQNCKMPLGKMPLPCILQDRGGRYFILAKSGTDQVLIMRPAEKVPVTLTVAQFQEEWNKKAIFLKHSSREHSDMQFGISWFLVTILEYKEQFVEVLVASFTLQVLGLFSPIIMQVVIDKVLVHNSLTTLDVLAVGLFAIIFFETLMSIARNYVFTNTTSKIDVILGDRLLKHLIHLPLAYFENRRTGVTIARVRELENIRRFLTGTPLTTVMDLMFVLVYIIVMLFYSRELTFIVLASLPLFALLSLLSMPAFKKRLDEKFAAGAEYQSYLVETITGVNTIKSLALEPDIQKKWGSLLAGYTKASYKTSILSGNINAIGGLIQKGFDLLILWVGAKLVISGEITVGQMIAFRMLSGRVSAPILRLVQLWQDFQQTKVSVDRIGDIFSVKQELDINQAKSRLPQIQGSIVFENVTFRYKMNLPEAISTMSFKIPAGKVIGIVGRSGSGKSTLTKLIQRLYIPETGKIMVDGVDISITDIEWLRRQIGVVLQENFLFNMTIRENICVNDPGASVEKMVEVCKIAGAHDFIVEMPGAYDTVLGENGTGLSGGQKQRLAIARALMDNPRILIFDEATSALDYESESIINANLKHICKGRTVLIIAHRLSIMRNADAVMVVDRGKLVEFNTQEKLLAQKGLYHYLYNQQFANAQGMAVNG